MCTQANKHQFSHVYYEAHPFKIVGHCFEVWFIFQNVITNIEHHHYPVHRNQQMEKMVIIRTRKQKLRTIKDEKKTNFSYTFSLGHVHIFGVHYRWPMYNRSLIILY